MRARRKPTCASPAWYCRFAAVATSLLAVAPMSVAGNDGVAHQAFANARGRVVFENERVAVERVEIAPGESTGRRVPGTDQIVVFIKGGLLRLEDSGRVAGWRDGRAWWLGALDRSIGAYTNAGQAPIDIEVVSLKPNIHVAAPGERGRPVSYPNLAGEDLLENDRVIVQYYELQPGQWEGPHEHGPNALWMFIHGGLGTSRTRLQPTPLPPTMYEDGAVGWMPRIDASVGHESANADSHPEDWLWITLKD